MKRPITLAEALYTNLEQNEYLIELYTTILFNYGVRVFQLTGVQEKPINTQHALRFADLLSKSTSNPNADVHKSLSQEIVTILHYLHPQDKVITHYLGSVLSNTSNYRGMMLEVPDYREDTILERMFNALSREYLAIPTDPSKQFFRSQKKIYDHLTDDYFSYSGPTSMGKSLVMRVFIKSQIQQGNQYNFVIVVPTKALINEVTTEVTKDLKELLRAFDYRIITSAGAVVLKEQHNFICIVTPERLQYLISAYKEFKIDFLFIDEAHKISVKEGRSAFYYTIVDRIAKKEPKPHIIFASPNIPNPEVYLQLIPNIDKTSLSSSGYSSSYTPVSQMKFLLDFSQKEISVFNPLTKKLDSVGRFNANETLFSFLKRLGAGCKNIVYVNSKDRLVSMALDYIADMDDLHDPDLDSLADEIQSEVHDVYYLAKTIRKGVAYHMGYLPSTIRLRVEELFKTGQINVMFCTSTLLEGVNLPADNLFITHYKNGRRRMDAVEFRNLIGRVGRIQYNLYGNVFFLSMEKEVEPQQYVELLIEEVPKQTLSISTLLTVEQKTAIIDKLTQGEVEFEKGTLGVEEYALMRRFANNLLHDILFDRASRVREEFDALLTPDVLEKIQTVFQARKDNIDADINVSLSQTERLIHEIANGAKYPRVNLYGTPKFEETVDFLEMLSRVFDWGCYFESRMIGKPNDEGKHPPLRRFAFLLIQWFQGKSLTEIIDDAIKFKHDNAGNNKGRVYIDRKSEKYDESPRHKNQIIADTLDTINEVVLFIFSNAFMTFTSEYKRFHNLESVSNDWYEFVEYGSTSPLTIMLERNGFSREAATYIKRNESTYTKITKDGTVLLLSLLNAPNATVSREANEVYYNIPELFET